MVVDGDIDLCSSAVGCVDVHHSAHQLHPFLGILQSSAFRISLGQPFAIVTDINGCQVLVCHQLYLDMLGMGTLYGIIYQLIDDTVEMLLVLLVQKLFVSYERERHLPHRLTVVTECRAESITMESLW